MLASTLRLWRNYLSRYRAYISLYLLRLASIVEEMQVLHLTTGANIYRCLAGLHCWLRQRKFQTLNNANSIFASVVFPKSLPSLLHNNSLPSNSHSLMAERGEADKEERLLVGSFNWLMFVVCFSNPGNESNSSCQLTCNSTVGSWAYSPLTP